MEILHIDFVVHWVDITSVPGNYYLFNYSGAPLFLAACNCNNSYSIVGLFTSNSIMLYIYVHRGSDVL